jgi:hypothetical protein
VGCAKHQGMKYKARNISRLPSICILVKKVKKRKKRRTPCPKATKEKKMQKLPYPKVKKNCLVQV